VNKQDTGQFDGRIDHAFNNANRAFFRYSRRDFLSLAPGPLPLPADGGLWTTIDLLATSYVFNWNAVVSPSMSNEFRFGFTRSDSQTDIPADSSPTDLGIKGLPDFGASNDHGVTRFVVSNYTGFGSRSYVPNPNAQNVYHITNHLTWIRGIHFMKFGVEYGQEAIARHAARFARGVMNFDGSFMQDPNNRRKTGQALADLPLGYASNGTLSNINGENMRVLSYAGFFQDDIKLARRLTVNLGVRWDRFGIPSFRELNTLPVNRFVLGPPGSTDW
jgi:TonB dependent receptor